MKIIPLLIISSLFFSICGLASSPSYKKFRWTADHFRISDFSKKIQVGALSNLKATSTPTASVNVGILAMRDVVLQGGGEVVGRSAQYVGPARVDGTWIQAIYSKTGQTIYTTGEIVENPPVELRYQAELLASNSATALRLLREKIPDSGNASYIFPPKVEIIWDEASNAYIPHWYLEYLTKSEDKVFYARISSGGEVLQRGEAAVNGADGRARVFSKGPRLSDLSEETLYGLVGDGSLSSAKLNISSALNLNIWSPEQTFFYDVRQPQFETVQVYYSIDKALSWFREILKVELLNPLRVRVHIGEGGVSNAAFYHDNSIYLGTGDGVVYRDILKDPTIVIHETVHAIIDQYAGLPSKGDGGGYNEGFADLFTALLLDHPNMGEVSWIKGPYRRTLKNDWKAFRDFAPGVYRNGSIVAGTFWDIREVIGVEKTATVAFRTMVRLGSGATFNDFVPAVISAASGVLSIDEMAKVSKIIADRGWRTLDGV